MLPWFSQIDTFWQQTSFGRTINFYGWYDNEKAGASYDEDSISGRSDFIRDLEYSVLDLNANVMRWCSQTFVSISVFGRILFPDIALSLSLFYPPTGAGTLRDTLIRCPISLSPGNIDKGTFCLLDSVLGNGKLFCSSGLLSNCSFDMWVCVWFVSVLVVLSIRFVARLLVLFACVYVRVCLCVCVCVCAVCFCVYFMVLTFVKSLTVLLRQPF